MTDKKITVIVVDDSALIRALLTEVLNSDDRIEVVATATDPFEARDLIKRHNPDVLTLDIEMPRMNGIAFLKNLMRLRPMPVVMISTLTQEGAPATLEALELGAVDFIAKPKNDGPDGIKYYAKEIVSKVLTAAKANIRHLSESAGFEHVKPSHIKDIGSKGKAGFICAIGASTGGTEAIKHVVTALPADCPPIVVTQHIPATFSASFANRVDQVAAAKVYEAVHDQKIERGCVYIAPGHSHMRIKKVGAEYVCTLDQGPMVNRHRPSVEVLFDSVIEAAGTRAIGIMLTGMGADGAQAMLRMREAGIYTLAQDEATSVVWGMPGAAVKLGAVEKALSLNEIAAEILRKFQE
ncbi:MAG: two-component system chemotaxis response regulator CheB [Flavobacteriales bacterium]|jgi:two-component system chemotaxis response regulator CheB